MKPEIMEEKMRSLEAFSGWKILPFTWTVIRLDGRNFSRFTELHFQKPFDSKFHEWMKSTARVLLEELAGIYAYLHSDEISLLLKPDWEFFDRRVEKILSISASLAGASFTHACGTPAHFESRLWVGVNPNLVIDYFRWRQAECERFAIHSWCYWLLRKDGYTSPEVTKILEGKLFEEKLEIMLQHKVNFKELPLWQRRGVALYWEKYEKEAFNKQKQKNVIVVRNKLKVNEEIPNREAYAEFLKKNILS